MNSSKTRKIELKNQLESAINMPYYIKRCADWKHYFG